MEIKELTHIVGLTLEFLGSISIAIAVLRVHRQVLIEHHIDKEVEDDIRSEMKYGIAGIILLTLGFLIQVLVF